MASWKTLRSFELSDPDDGTIRSSRTVSALVDLIDNEASRKDTSIVQSGLYLFAVKRQDLEGKLDSIPNATGDVRLKSRSEHPKFYLLIGFQELESSDK